MASIAPYKSGYRAQVCVNRQRDTKTFRTRREAVAWGAARETELRTQAATPSGDRHTLAEVMRRYVAEISPLKGGERWERIRVEALLADPNFPVGKIGAITPEAIGQWRDHRSRHVKPGTVLRELGLLSAIFEHARREWRMIAVNPIHDVRKPPEPRHRDVLITRQQIRAMLCVMGYSQRLPIRSVAQSVACCFLVALRTGMRAGELCALTWADVEADYCRVQGVAKGAKKTGRRDVPLSPKAARAINRMRGFDPALVFGLGVQSLDAMFRKYRNRAGLSGFVFHDARHYAATHMAKKLHVLDLCRAFGWSNPKRAMVYVNTPIGDISKRL